MDLLDAKLEMDSVPGQGTRFSVTLGAAEINFPIAANGTDEKQFSRLRWKPLANQKVLILEDNVDVVNGLITLLDAYDCQCQTAENGDHANRIVQSWQPDVAIIDVRLRAGEYGVSVAEQLISHCPDLKIALITGETSPQVLADISASGFDVYHKPVSGTALRGILIPDQNSIRTV